MLKALERNHRRVQSLELHPNQPLEIFDFYLKLIPQARSLIIGGNTQEGRLEQVLSKVNSAALEFLSIAYTCEIDDVTAVKRFFTNPLPRLKEIHLELRDSALSRFDNAYPPLNEKRQSIMIPIMEKLSVSARNLERLQIRPDRHRQLSEKSLSQLCQANAATIKFVNVLENDFLLNVIDLSRISSSPKSWKPYDDLCRQKFCVGLSGFCSNGKNLWSLMQSILSAETTDELLDLCLPSPSQQVEAIIKELMMTNTERQLTDKSRSYFLSKGAAVLAKSLPELQLHELAPLFRLAQFLLASEDPEISSSALKFIQASIDMNFEVRRRVPLEARTVQALIDDPDWSCTNGAIKSIQSCVDDYGTWLELNEHPGVLLNVIHFLGHLFFQCKRSEEHVKQINYQSYYAEEDRSSYANAALYLAYLRARGAELASDGFLKSLEDHLKDAHAWSSQVGYKKPKS